MTRMCRAHTRVPVPTPTTPLLRPPPFCHTPAHCRPTSVGYRIERFGISMYRNFRYSDTSKKIYRTFRYIGFLRYIEKYRTVSRHQYFHISHRKLSTSRYIEIYGIKRVFALHPLLPPVFFSPTLNESFDVSNIPTISIIFFVVRYRVEVGSDIDIQHCHIPTPNRFAMSAVFPLGMLWLLMWEVTASEFGLETPMWCCRLIGPSVVVGVVVLVNSRLRRKRISLGVARFSKGCT